MSLGCSGHKTTPTGFGKRVAKGVEGKGVEGKGVEGKRVFARGCDDMTAF
jgi:hypothetical protein